MFTNGVKMPYSLPQFNLYVKLWRDTDQWPGDPTDFFFGQLYLTSRPLLDVTPGDPAAWCPPIYLRLPPLSDIRPQDQVEVPADTERLYLVRWVDDVHKGFENEYRVALLEQTRQTFPLQ